MNMTYYETVTKLEKMGAEREYIQGWVGGYLHNPKREEQRITDAYSAGYDDGMKGGIEHAQTWVKK
jgi:hypothetical protein